jgi:hypothetical protein
MNSTAKPLLQAGTKYWICDEPTAGNSYNGWYYNNQGHANGFAFERSEWGWSAVPAPAPNSGVFEVSVTPVPEPSAMDLGILFGGCLFFVWLAQKAHGYSLYLRNKLPSPFMSRAGDGSAFYF